MPRVPKLDDEAVRSALEDLPGWSLRDGKLHRELKRKNFIDAFGLMSRIALVAERMDHHPEWSNVYNRITIDLTTHDAGGISEKDFELARAIDRLVAD